MSDEEYEEASAETKLAVSTFFMSSAPPGEIKEVLADCQKLVSDSSVLTTAAVNTILSNYNTTNMVPAKDSEGNKVIPHPAGKRSENDFVDPATGRVVTFNHSQNTFTASGESVSLPDNVKKYRDAVDAEMGKYIANNFKSGKCATATFGNDNGTLTICVSAQNTKLSAFWTGGWKSYYTLDVSSTGSKKLTGNIKVVVHYFEDGNVQLHTDMDQSVDVSVGDAAATGAAVAKAISNLESSFQSNLEEMYVNMHRSTFKSMRRFLPLNGQPMNWNPAAHSIQTGM